MGSVWIKSTLNLQPASGKPTSHRSNQWFDLNTKYRGLSATIEHFRPVLSVISIIYGRTMHIDTVFSHLKINYTLKASIYTIFGYQSVNQPVGDLYLNLQIQVSFSKMVDSDS